MSALAEQSNSRVSSPSRTKKFVTRVQPRLSWRPETGKPVVLDRQLVLEDEGEEEDGDGDADQRDDDERAVEGGVGPPRRDVPEGDRDDDGDDERGDAQLDRRGEAGEEDVEGVGARQDAGGDAEVTVGRAPEELAVLHPDRLVEPEGLGQRRPGLRRGPLTEDRGDGAAGQRPQPQEDQEGEDEDDAHHLEEASDDESRQRGLLVSGWTTVAASNLVVRGGHRRYTCAVMRCSRAVTCRP